MCCTTTPSNSLTVSSGSPHDQCNQLISSKVCSQQQCQQVGAISSVDQHFNPKHARTTLISAKHCNTTLEFKNARPTVVARDDSQRRFPSALRLSGRPTALSSHHKQQNGLPKSHNVENARGQPSNQANIIAMSGAWSILTIQARIRYTSTRV
jgi:hypothetical protein